MKRYNGKKLVGGNDNSKEADKAAEPEGDSNLSDLDRWLGSFHPIRKNSLRLRR